MAVVGLKAGLRIGTLVLALTGLGPAADVRADGSNGSARTLPKLAAAQSADAGVSEAAGADIHDKRILAENPLHPGIGSKEAPVLLLMFQDLKCGMCAYAHRELLLPLQRDYVAQGKLRIEFVENPLIEAEDELGLAAAAQCAGEQNKYFEYLSYLYENMKSTAAREGGHYAGLMGLDENAFQRCLSSQQVREKVRRDRSTAEALGINGTPTFFLNGRKIIGAMPYPQFTKEIERALEEAEHGQHGKA